MCGGASRKVFVPASVSFTWADTELGSTPSGMLERVARKGFFFAEGI